MDLPALPYPFSFDPAACALLVIDTQRGFLEPGGFGQALGNDIAPRGGAGRLVPRRDGGVGAGMPSITLPPAFERSAAWCCGRRRPHAPPRT